VEIQIEELYSFSLLPTTFPPPPRFFRHTERCPSAFTYLEEDGCLNTLASEDGGDEETWYNAICTRFDHWHGNTPQLFRFRDSTQEAADASFDKVYSRFGLDWLGNVWVNIKWNPNYNSAWDETYWGNDREAHKHQYRTVERNGERIYHTYSHLPNRWKWDEPNDLWEQCLEVMKDGSRYGLNDEDCGNHNDYWCQVPALCQSGEKRQEFGCVGDPKVSYYKDGVCTPCPHGRANYFDCICNAGSKKVMTGSLVECQQCPICAKRDTTQTPMVSRNALRAP
jgi:hypothetical protein